MKATQRETDELRLTKKIQMFLNISFNLIILQISLLSSLLWEKNK